MLWYLQKVTTTCVSLLCKFKRCSSDEVMKEKMSSILISLEEIFTSINWEDRGYTTGVLIIFVVWIVWGHTLWGCETNIK